MQKYLQFQIVSMVIISMMLQQASAYNNAAECNAAYARDDIVPYAGYPCWCNAYAVADRVRDVDLDVCGDCPSGVWCSTDFTSAPSACPPPPGACADGSFSADGIEGCMGCTDVTNGFFGADASDSYVSTAATKQVACADGSFNADGNGACTDVDDGFFGADASDSYVSTAATKQVACADGSFNADGNGACTDVTNGFFGADASDGYVSTAATKQVACADGSGECASWTDPSATTCNDGSFWTEGTTTADSSCVECGSGTFSASNNAACAPHTSCGTQTGGGARLTGESTTATGSCNDCAQGTYAGSATGNCEDWTDPSATTCNDGSFWTEGTTTADSTCVECGTGQYSVSNNDPCASWTNADATTCADGSVWTTGSTTADSTCVECGTGQYSVSNNDACAPHTSCGEQTDNTARLTGSSTTAAGSCDNCDQGTYAGSATDDCASWTNPSADTCADGYFWTTGSDIVDSTCLDEPGAGDGDDVTTTAELKKGDKKIPVNNIAGIKKGDSVTITNKDGSKKDTTTVVQTTTGQRRATAGYLTVADKLANDYDLGAQIRITAQPTAADNDPTDTGEQAPSSTSGLSDLAIAMIIVSGLLCVVIIALLYILHNKKNGTSRVMAMRV